MIRFYLTLSKILFLFSLFATIESVSASISIKQTPIATAYTPNSVLSNPSSGRVYYEGGRPRYSTCSGVAWFGNDRSLATVNVAKSALQVYRFIENSCSLELVKDFDNSNNLHLKGPVDLTFSNNHQLLAISNMSSGDVNVYKFDSESYSIKPPFKPTVTLTGNKNAHGATFSPTEEYLSVTHTKYQGKICTYRIEWGGGKNIAITLTQDLQNPFYPLKPKCIAFSSDSKFVVIGYCVQIFAVPGDLKAVLASHKFDAKRGKIDPTPISCIDNLFSAESISMTSDSSTLLVTDQGFDRVTAHEFDPNTGMLGESYIVLENPEAQLSHPHGLMLSSDDRFLAVTSMGDDKVTVYEVTKE